MYGISYIIIILIGIFLSGEYLRKLLEKDRLMSIIIVPGHREIAEVEFAGKHPDIFTTYLVAEAVKRLAIVSSQADFLQHFRADLNAQASSLIEKINGITPIKINLVGQVIIPDKINLEKLTRIAAIELLDKTGYFKTPDFSPEHVYVDIEGVTSQSSNLNGTTKLNKFGDTCVVYGHHILKPSGINGTFPSLFIGKKIDQTLEKIITEQFLQLGPDGKGHIRVRYTPNGIVVEDVYISVAHPKNVRPNFREQVAKALKAKIKELGEIYPQINAGGDFNVYFVQADYGVSGKKDGVIITGGIHQIGTDAFWGKCLFKSSSVALPYAFALSKVVCEVTGAKYASVGVNPRYGQEDDTYIWLNDIDPRFEEKREDINRALQKVPKDRSGIMEILRFPVSLTSYVEFNDPGGFHNSSKPWKRYNPELTDIFRRAYRSVLHV